MRIRLARDQEMLQMLRKSHSVKAVFRHENTFKHAFSAKSPSLIFLLLCFDKLMENIFQYERNACFGRIYQGSLSSVATYCDSGERIIYRATFYLLSCNKISL